MVIQQLSLHNFRNYTTSEFSFSPQMTIIVGPNASGKSNLLEAVVFLATGRGLRAEKDQQIIRFGQTNSRVQGQIKDSHLDLDNKLLDVAFYQQNNGLLQRKYLVNGVTKSRANFAGNLTIVHFSPIDLGIVIGQPADRREFLNHVLGQADRDYRLALTTYTKAIRQRNALLENTQRSGSRQPDLFSYWDDLLIRNGQLITQKRERLIAFINQHPKRFFPFTIAYDKSTISHERLLQYKDAEIGAGVTLVGPHRDELFIETIHKISQQRESVKNFSSRGQQRLVVLELKLSQISFLKSQTGGQPVLLLDDIFSELDREHIAQVLTVTNECQTILTTTHKEFISHMAPEAKVVELQ